MNYKFLVGLLVGTAFPLASQIVIPSFSEEESLAKLTKNPSCHVERFYEGFKLYANPGLDKLSNLVQGPSSPINKKPLYKIYNNKTNPREVYLTDLIAWDSQPGSGGGEFNGIHFFFNDNVILPLALRDALQLGSIIEAVWLVPNANFSFHSIVTVSGKDQTHELGTGEIRMVNANRWMILRNSAGQILSVLLLGQPLNSPIALPDVIFKREGPLADDSIYQSLARALTSIKVMDGYGV